MRIEAVTSLEDPEEYADILREFLTPVFETFAARTGTRIETRTAVATTIDNIPAYLPPHGGLWLARDHEDHLVGTAALKMIRPDAAEIKRVFVRPSARGHGLGRTLSELAVTKAKELGARRVYLDSAEWLAPAHRIYRSLGFDFVRRYPESENPDAFGPHLIYMEKLLT